MPTDTLAILQKVVELRDIGEVGAGTTFKAVAERARAAIIAELRAKDEAHRVVLRALLADGMTQGDVLGVLHESGTGKDGVTADHARDLAIEQHADQSDGDIEVDDNPIFSATNAGLWVNGWVWLSNDALGTKKPVPDEMRGKLWLVDFRQDNAPPVDVVEGDFGRCSVVTIKSATDAVNKHDEIVGEFQCLVLADTREDAAQVAQDYADDKDGLSEKWWSDPDDDAYGFAYLLRVN